MTSWYERLSVLDCSFLALEGPNCSMHIAATALFEGAPVVTKDGGVDIARLRAYVESCLPNLPRYRQRLAYIPLENHAVWVDDERFELAYHVRHTSLPRPGSGLQLQELCARLLERPLDRAKPLWEIWVIEGLAGGRFALLLKAHHCMVDGVGGVELLAALLRPTPDADLDLPTAWHPRPAPSGAELIRDEVARRAQMSVALLRRLRGSGGVRQPGEADWGQSLKAVWALLRDGMRRPVASPLNQPIGPHRRVRWTTCDLAALKDVKNQLGGTVNDVVLTVVSGAVRRFFERRGWATDGADFRVGVPVNMRGDAERRVTSNRVSIWLVSLPIRERRAAHCLQAVREASQRLKETRQAAGTEILMRAAEWTSTNVLTLGSSLSTQVQPFNLIVTNVPGPQCPLYLLGARMEAIYPQVPLFENQGLGIALFSYDGKLCWGFIGDWDVLPDLDEFVRDVEASFRHLRQAARRRRAMATRAPRQPVAPPTVVRRPPIRRGAGIRPPAAVSTAEGVLVAIR